VKDAPSIGTDGELPVGGEEAIFKHHGLAYQPGAGGERRLARRSAATWGQALSAGKRCLGRAPGSLNCSLNSWALPL
jgi:hypothetical protein